MSSQNIPICLQGANIYLVFKLNILEDQISDNYVLVGSFQREDDANEFVNTMNSFETRFKVIKHKMLKTSNPNINILRWKEDLNAWILPIYQTQCDEGSQCDDDSDNIITDNNFDNYQIVTVKEICNYLGLPI